RVGSGGRRAALAAAEEAGGRHLQIRRHRRGSRGQCQHPLRNLCARLARSRRRAARDPFASRAGRAMQHSDFVHLHNHSDYSLLDGADPISRMVERAAELKMPALALTDHGALFGAVEFYQEARKAGVKPIVGMEAYVTRGNRADRTRDTAHHLVLLAKDEPGFHNLMKLSLLAYLEGFYYKPRVDHEILAKYAEGLVALSACPKGEIATDLL